MALINIPAFSGLNILAAPQRIRDDEATIAIGCDFRSLDLRPFRSDSDTGLGVLDPTTALANGVSIFQWDETTWMGTLGDKNYARNPTFYADGTTGQRIFIADNAAPYPEGSPEIAWNWVQEVEKTDLGTTGNRPAVGGVGSYGLTGPTRRLGIPKPAAINMKSVEYEKKNGRVTSLIRTTNADTLIEVDSAAQDSLKTGNKLVLDVPGIGDGPFTISKKSAATPPAFTLRGGRMTYVDIEIIKTSATTEIKFKKVNHGLIGGEQVILNRKANSDANLINRLPTSSPVFNQTVYEVVRIDEDTFRLVYGESATELALTNSDTNAVTTTSMKYALVASSDDTIPTPWDVSKVIVNTLTNYQQKVTYYNIPDDVTSTWEIANEDLIERSYVVTFVNSFGDESEPSDPTQVIAVAQGDPVKFKQISGALALPITAASYSGELSGSLVSNFRQPDRLRLYRTDASGTYRLVTTEVDDARKITWTEAGTTDFVFEDKYEDTDLGEPLATQGWQIPPKDLNGILISPGGSLVGYKDRSVFGSVPYAPYAFPLSNRVAFDYFVKGLVATSAGLVVVTDGMPALIVGDDPATWTVQKLEYPYGCVSRRSIVDMGEMAIYASASGLIGIAGANVEILTKDTIKREDWQSLYNPSQIRAAHAEGRYYAITTVGNTRKAFMFDPRTRAFVDIASIDMSAGTYPISLYSRLYDDTLLIMKSDGKVYAWNRGNTWERYTWRSKAFQLNRPEIMGCCQIVAPALIANWDFIFRLYGWDGEGYVLIATFSTETETNDPPNRQYKLDKNVNPFRLPLPVDRYTAFTVELEGTLPIAQITIAGVIDELKQI